MESHDCSVGKKFKEYVFLLFSCELIGETRIHDEFLENNPISKEEWKYEMQEKLRIKYLFIVIPSGLLIMWIERFPWVDHVVQKSDLNMQFSDLLIRWSID